MRDGPQIEAFLESNSQPQAHCAAVINAFLRVGIEQLAKVLVTSDISDYRLKRCRVDPKVEVAEQREAAPAAAVVSVRREQRMVKDIIDICPDLRRPAFTEMKVLVNAKVYTPGSGSLQHISRRNIGIAEEVCADRRQIECVGIKNLVANAVIGVTGHDGPIARLDVEVANGVRRSYADIAGRNRKAVVADPERRETSSRLGKHVETGLPSPDHRIRPLGEMELP